MIAPLIDGAIKPLSFFILERFPIYDALDALATIDAAAAALVVTRELKQQLDSNMRSGELFSAAMRLPAPEGDEARELLLGEANDDHKLQDLVNLAARHHHLPWLTTRIAADLASGCPAFIARGMTLAAFLPECDEADVLWTGQLAVPPCAGWLAQVHTAASMRFARQRRARHWFDAFTAALEPETAYAALRLFVAEVDSRIYAGDILRPGRKDLAGWPAFKRAHWYWNSEAIKAAVKRDEDQLKKTLLFSPQPGHAQYPKLR